MANGISTFKLSSHFRFRELWTWNVAYFAQPTNSERDMRKKSVDSLTPLVLLLFDRTSLRRHTVRAHFHRLSQKQLSTKKKQLRRKYAFISWETKNWTENLLCLVSFCPLWARCRRGIVEARPSFPVRTQNRRQERLSHRRLRRKRQKTAPSCDLPATR